MTDGKPQVVLFSDEREMANLVTLKLSDQFHVTPVTDVDRVDDALEALRKIRPDYIIIDPQLPRLDHELLFRRIQADEGLKGIQILIVRNEERER